MSETVNTKLILSELSDKLAELDFVEWDRYTGGRWSDNSSYVTVYGWVDREDEYKDFVEIIRWDNGQLYFTTSSAEHTEDIFEVLFEDSLDNHNDCKRVEDVLDIDNVVELDAD